MEIRGHTIAVCSWSLHPKDVSELVAAVKEVGLNHIQFNLGSILNLDDKRKHQELGVLRNSGVQITAGMLGYPGEDYSTISKIRATGGYLPDDQWPLRKKLTEQAIKLSAELGIKRITTHIGFVPPSSDAKYNLMLDRLNEVADLYAKNEMAVMFETGQERAPELLQFLNDLHRPNVYVNFDPANMILYGAGDPIEAIQTLGRHIGHVHVKDAILSDQPAVNWGTEVPFGTGQVNPAAFLDALHSVKYTGPLAIEREAGATRIADIKAAILALQSA